VLGLLALLAAGALALLDPRQLSARSETLHVVVRTRGGSDGTAILVRHDDRWVGSVRELPNGSVTHVKPRGSPGLFLVRAAGESFRAYSDRSPHRGQPVEYRDPMPGRSNHADGPLPVFYDLDAGAVFTLEGESVQGPAPRPLDPFPRACSGIANTPAASRR
jgi:hypothetical protein